MTDIEEMDAASNNSVEDIRSIKEKVNFLPTFAKYRVYIIDEVHMLSTSAFNALLKTLEEPPEHVKFILATTEPQKLLATILSRCQRFDFKKISNENIIKRLKVVCEESKIQITDGALNLIASLSEGAARDALSILERCLQDGDTFIDEEKIKDLVGIPKFVYVHNIIKGILNKDIESSLNAMNDILDEGKDLENFLWEMIKYTKDILMYKVSKKLELYSEEEEKQIKELTEKVSKEELINIIYKLSELESKMKLSSQKIIIFETEIIKLCVKMDTSGLEDRIASLEKKIESGNIKVTSNVNTIPVVNSKENVIQRENQAQTKKAENTDEKVSASPVKAQKLTPGEKIDSWQTAISNIKSQGKVMLYANLINTEAVQVNDMTVAIRFHNGLNSFRKDLIGKPENMNILNKEVAMICGKPMQIKLEDATDEAKPKSAPRQTIPVVQREESNPLDDLDIPINFIEEE